ncbi:MAG: hypothetical protein LAO78_15840 [Acidobacteriia bacterium]|nr:hypothetical protein [Terriglobia bacterium]
MAVTENKRSSAHTQPADPSSAKHRSPKRQAKSQTKSDKTAVHFVIEPSFTLDTEYADWKTGNWRPLKRWPLIPSASGIRRK